MTAFFNRNQLLFILAILGLSGCVTIGEKYSEPKSGPYALLDIKGAKNPSYIEPNYVCSKFGNPVTIQKASHEIESAETGFITIPAYKEFALMQKDTLGNLYCKTGFVFTPVEGAHYKAWFMWAKDFKSCSVGLAERKDNKYYPVISESFKARGNNNEDCPYSAFWEGV